MLGRKLSPNGEHKRRSPLSPVIDASGKSGDEFLPTTAIYEAESPDELALVNAARAYNVKLLKRTSRNAIVSLPDKSILSFEILQVSLLRTKLCARLSVLFLLVPFVFLHVDYILFFFFT